MVAFTIYAILVGYCAVHWRRRVLGFVLVSGLILPLVLLAWAHYQIPRLAAEGYELVQDVNIRPFQAILYPYIVCVGMMGYFLASLPRGRPIDSCWHCRYDLSALLDESTVITCPECGREHVGRGSSRYRRSGVDRVSLRSSDIAVGEQRLPVSLITTADSSSQTPRPPGSSPPESCP